MKRHGCRRCLESSPAPQGITSRRPLSANMEGKPDRVRPRLESEWAFERFGSRPMPSARSVNWDGSQSRLESGECREAWRSTRQRSANSVRADRLGIHPASCAGLSAVQPRGPLPSKAQCRTENRFPLLLTLLRWGVQSRTGWCRRRAVNAVPGRARGSIPSAPHHAAIAQGQSNTLPTCRRRIVTGWPLQPMLGKLIW